jgi:hypothetical protein
MIYEGDFTIVYILRERDGTTWLKQGMAGVVAFSPKGSFRSFYEVEILNYNTVRLKQNGDTFLITYDKEKKGKKKRTVIKQ